MTGIRRPSCATPPRRLLFGHLAESTPLTPTQHIQHIQTMHHMHRMHHMHNMQHIQYTEHQDTKTPRHRETERPVHQYTKTQRHKNNHTQPLTITTRRQNNNTPTTHQHHTNTQHHTTTHQQQQQPQPQPEQQPQPNVGRLSFYMRGASTPLWRVESRSLASMWPNPIPPIPAHVVKTPQLDSDANAGNEKYLKEKTEKKEEEMFFRKMEKWGNRSEKYESGHPQMGDSLPLVHRGPKIEFSKKNRQLFSGKFSAIFSFCGVQKEKQRKNMKKTKNEEIWKNDKCVFVEYVQSFCFQTQNPRRFTGFVVVVVILFDEILDDFHVLFQKCVFVKKKTNNQFWGLTVCQRKGDFFWTCQKDTHFIDENWRTCSLLVPASLTIIILQEGTTAQHKTQHNTPTTQHTHTTTQHTTTTQQQHVKVTPNGNTRQQHNNTTQHHISNNTPTTTHKQHTTETHNRNTQQQRPTPHTNPHTPTHNSTQQHTMTHIDTQHQPQPQQSQHRTTTHVCNNT